jgi:hypothetical protein
MFLMLTGRVGAAATAVSCLHEFYSTNSGNVWMDGSWAFPTILNAMAAFIIFLWSGIVLCGYVFGKSVEMRLAGYTPWAAFIRDTLAAFAAAIMLGTASQPQSLESQTCSNSPPAGVSATSFCFKQVHL